MKIAIEGCAHGELEKIYDSIAHIEQKEGFKVDLLICCGDFQSTRNLDDLNCMAVPRKFQDICTFYKYYSGEKTAPILTIFIGGNHEASNYLQELPYGGWVAPKIYYLGYAGVVKVNGIRIGGISGIYKGFDFFRGHYESSPYNDTTKRSIYHIRQLEVFRLKQLSGKVDIFLSHDWPRGICDYGNVEQLLQRKPFLREDIENNKLGSPPSEDLLKILKPSYWFSAHLHCKFAALVKHDDSDNDEKNENKKTTKFLALDKCLPKRRFLQIVDINIEPEIDSESFSFEYDLEWLTILYLTNHLLSVKNAPHYMPGPQSLERFQFTPTDEEKELVSKKFSTFIIPENFKKTAYSFSLNSSTNYSKQPAAQTNPQTTLFCDTLGIDDPLRLVLLMSGQIPQLSEMDHQFEERLVDDEIDEENSSEVKDDSINLGSNIDNIVQSPFKSRAPLASTLPKPKWVIDTGNPEEINLDDEDGCKSDDQTKEEVSGIEEFKTSKLDVNEDDDESKTTVEEITPPIKKIKRRNESIYTANENSD